MGSVTTRFRPFLAQERPGTNRCQPHLCRSATICFVMYPQLLLGEVTSQSRKGFLWIIVNLAVPIQGHSISLWHKSCAA